MKALIEWANYLTLFGLQLKPGNHFDICVVNTVLQQSCISF